MAEKELRNSARIINKGWHLRAVHRLVKIKDTGSTYRKKGSGRPRTAMTDENREHVEEVIVSQEDEPGRHKSQQKIASELNVSRRSVQRMAKELKLEAFKRIHVSRRGYANVRLKGMVLAQMPCRIFALKKHITYNPEDQMNTLTQL
jgi:biotin operon repressor